jgi:hypothetical protein
VVAPQTPLQPAAEIAADPFVVGVMLPRELLSLAAHSARDNARGYVCTWTNYKSSRRMGRWHDLVDWVGGFRSRSPSRRQFSGSIVSEASSSRTSRPAAADSVATSSSCGAAPESMLGVMRTAMGCPGGSGS